MKASTILIGLGLVLGVAIALSINESINANLHAGAGINQLLLPTPVDQGDVSMIVPEPQTAQRQVAPTLSSPSNQSQGGQAPLTPQGTGGASPLPVAQMPARNPDRIVIPAIGLDARVIRAASTDIQFQGANYRLWLAPDSFAVGWIGTSVPLGISGNTVLIGHHNVYGEVFGRLVDLRVGDRIVVYSGKTAFNYQIAQRMILQEQGEPLDVRLKNARWIAPSQDERLTLVTCWPRDDNTHRLIIVATPLATINP